MNLPGSSFLKERTRRSVVKSGPAGRVTIGHWKHTLDTLLILLALPFLIPLTLLIALLIRSGSSGPILFNQERVGYLGRRFRCFKFRTMVANADTMAHQEHMYHLINSIPLW
jgi:lipopolysaccharide/colanic/teichoic acid biosynthesis glycosyltransferase